MPWALLWALKDAKYQTHHRSQNKDRKSFRSLGLRKDLFQFLNLHESTFLVRFQVWFYKLSLQENDLLQYSQLKPSTYIWTSRMSFLRPKFVENSLLHFLHFLFLAAKLLFYIPIISDIMFGFCIVFTSRLNYSSIISRLSSEISFYIHDHVHLA